ncbi:MAG: peptide-methionine (S)-S-oxide reductase MsrA [Betaproteobacteria bacterium]|nr:peptide-methionine (S)-S-oxide reductase MsrA [Betaproteobacteria bacterium]
MNETATLGGGCFWCLEAAYECLRGVLGVESGYMGGQVERPSYEAVCNGDTGHAEVVQVRFDPAVIAYREILEVFFAIHDPTTPNRQGNDRGSQYRSAIFCHSPEQLAAARGLIAELTEARAFVDPIVTEVATAPAFWPAEAYHQGYFRKHPSQGYCVAVVAPKLAKFRERYSSRLKTP